MRLFILVLPLLLTSCAEAARALAHSSELVREKVPADARAAILKLPRLFLEQCRSTPGT